MFSFERISRTVLTVGVLVVSTLAGSPAVSQVGVDRPVIVAVPDVFPRQKLPPGHATSQPPRAVVMRFARSSGKQDMIVLHGDKTSPALLREALRVLRAHRIRRPEPDHDHVVVIPDLPPGRQRAAVHTAHAQAKLTELLGRPRGRHEALGQARWIELTDFSAYIH